MTQKNLRSLIDPPNMMLPQYFASDNDEFLNATILQQLIHFPKIIQHNMCVTEKYLFIEYSTHPLLEKNVNYVLTQGHKMSRKQQLQSLEVGHVYNLFHM